MSRFRCLVAIGLVSACVIVSADDWPQFRGTNADGIAGSTLPTQWAADEGETQNIKWQVPIQGEGWSSPIISNGQIFLTAAVPVDEDKADAAKPTEYSGGGGSRRDDLTSTTFHYDVICLDAATGKENWRRTAKQGRPPMPRHSSNTYATETPVTDGKSIFAYFGMNGVYCYDLAGELRWQKDLGSFEMRAGWGTSSSPVLFDGKLYIQVDNEEQSFVIALDADSGEEVWRVNREEKSQYSSPIIWTNSKRSELIVGGVVYRSYDPMTGDLLWQLDMEKGRSSATPIAVGNRLFVGTELRNRGGDDDGGGFLFAIKPGGSGDITPPNDATDSEFIAWKTDSSDIQMASPTFCDGHLYFLERRAASVTCVNAETGDIAYKQRIRGARAFWASPWSDGKNVYCLDTGGTTYVIAGGAAFRLVSENVIDEQAWSTPGIADGAIYLRTLSHLYSIAEPSKSSE
ncbi:outer membrane protein assembly factor BamB family protein [Stieleria varia]|uniref:outer membrane protein assembly factor BamB family protein n=1 Tax=Stieleria varia TaxID=2528005 RepID=UPI001E3CD78B|nr:PQQ-binding-like beta-propeller repeat protein [Stieleria varia]